MTRITVDGNELVRGIAIAHARVLEENQSVFETRLNIEAVDQRIERFHFALQQTKIELLKIRNYTEDRIGAAQAAIFDAHMMLLDDSAFIEAITSRIDAEQDPVQALNDWRLSSKEELKNMGDYLSGRQSDVDDITQRLALHMIGNRTYDVTQIDEEIIIVAEMLTPSFMASLDPRVVKGIIVAEGSPFAHTTMLSETMQIPLFQVDKPEFHLIRPGDVLILDTESSFVIIRPTSADIEAFEDRKQQLAEQHAKLESLKGAATLSQDGVAIKLLMNVNGLNQLRHYDDTGAEGIGLVRTEFLFSGQERLPNEDAQYEVYKSILKSTKESVTIRTLDYGGDKRLLQDKDKLEANPFLGTRGVRYTFKHIDLLLTQLRALLRASVHGQLRILFPFVTTVDELNDLLRIMEQLKKELLDEQLKYEEVEIGVMLETPGAALMAKQFAARCDFLSLGTNDLAQYMFAADRGNHAVAKYNDTKSPAMLEVIRHVVKGASELNTPVTICGDIARDKTMLPLLIGLGVRQLSMEHTYILNARQLIGRLSVTSVEKLVEQAVVCAGGEQVELLVKDYLHHL